MSPTPSSWISWAQADPGGAGTDDGDGHLVEALADHAGRVAQRGEHDDRRAVLVVVEDGDRQSFAQALLDLEAQRRGDVLEVDPTEAGGERDHRVHDLVGGGCVEADRVGVDVPELLEQHRLALHHGQRGFGADVAEAEHGAAVGDDGDGVAATRQAPDLGGVRSDGARHAADARRVGECELVGAA